MNRQDFIAHIAQTQGVTKTEAEKTIASFIAGINSAVAAGRV
ncbi:DNA binding protein [Klebsiella phage UPM 2146]|uniref:DNA binding protein n=1 Tax=Klebsiella phage UPM 2146 TaxID=2847816 RepID=A0A5Q2F1K2_9CAUD|nr:DNA binding protein [Klebsiella phage UPM 2146]QGF20726.1 DNA binding protein [Klebsiella phage UPM 2146]